MTIFRLLLHSLTEGYYDFEGRASRLEYFTFSTFYWLILLIAFSVVPSLIKNVVLQNVALITVIGGLVLPKFALSFRRLQDSDLSSGWLLLNAIPIVGWLILLYLKCRPSTQGKNRFGLPPSV